MTEVIGYTASVMTIVEAIAYVTKFIRSCKHAPQESQHLVRELSYVRGLLITLQETIDEQESSNKTWSSTGVLLNDGNGLLPHFQQLLDALDLRIGGPSRKKGLTKFTHSVKWPFKESETLKLLNTVERYKGLFELALDNNHIRLSKAIHDNVKHLSTTVQEMKDELSSYSQDVKALDVRNQHVQEKVIESTQQLKLLNLKNKGKLGYSTTKVSQESLHYLKDKLFIANGLSRFRVSKGIQVAFNVELLEPTTRYNYATCWGDMCMVS